LASYQDRILKAIRESEGGLTTVDVAKQAGVSKTTVIKYLSVLKSEGKCEYVEVGPSKLWKASQERPKRQKDLAGKLSAENGDHSCEVEAISVSALDDSISGDSPTISLSFKIKADQILALMKQIQNSIHQ